MSEFRLNLELSATELKHIELHRVVADFELKSHTENAVGKHRYRLFDEVVDPIGKRKIVVHPDLMFILRSQGKSGKMYQRLYFVEIDRGTEGLSVIRDKLVGYHLYQREGVFKKFGDFEGFRVLVQVNSERRMGNIGDVIRNQNHNAAIWIGHEIEIKNKNVLSQHGWCCNGDQYQIVS